MLNGEERLEVVRRLNEMRAKRSNPTGSRPIPFHDDDPSEPPSAQQHRQPEPLEEDFLVSEFLMRDSGGS